MGPARNTRPSAACASRHCLRAAAFRTGAVASVGTRHEARASRRHRGAATDARARSQRLRAAAVSRAWISAGPIVFNLARRTCQRLAFAPASCGWQSTLR
jgi:hypothetical protein